MRNRAESADGPVRHALLLRMRDAFDHGERDPELLFLGARYAASLALHDEARRFAELLEDQRVAGLLLRKDDERKIEVKRVLDRIASSPAAKLAGSATAAYAARDLAAARITLEDLLLLQADRADVLWNLLVVASEQQDVEAYDRYWRRFAQLQLVRMLRREPGAREELVRFYTFVATATDRPFAESPVKVAETLTTLGLLPRWLESHAALAWLDEPRPALCRFWFHLFYPQLEPFLDDGKPPRRSARPTPLKYDPALNLLTRFAEWSRVQFALPENDAHAETIRALAHCVARIRWQPYVARVTAVLRGPDQEIRPFRQSMQEAVSLPIGSRLGELLDAQNWRGIADDFGDIAAAVTPTLRLFLALACCHLDDEQRGYEIALQTLPDLSAQDLDAESQATIVWKNVLQANMHAAAQAKGQAAEKLGAIRKRLRAAPAPGRVAAFVAAREAEINETLRQIEQRQRVDAAIEATQRHIEHREFHQARTVIRKLEDEPPDLAELKKKLLADIDQIEESYKVQERVSALVSKGEFNEAHKVLNTLPSEEPGRKALARAVNEAQKEAKQQAAVEKAVENAKTHVEKRQFDDARRDVRNVPEPLKAQFLSQIDEAEKEAKTVAVVESAVEDAKRHVENGKFDQARRAVRNVPEPLKAQFLAQIDEAEKAARTHEKIEKAIDDAKAHVAKGKFTEARRALGALPDDLKKKLLQQVDEAAKEAKTAAVVESAVEDAKRHVENGKFDQARRAVRNVPEPLKAQFLAQIGEAESHVRALNEENAALRRTLSNRGIGSSEIDRLARLNNLDTDNPAALNALLQAIKRQVG